MRKLWVILVAYLLSILGACHHSSILRPDPLLPVEVHLSAQVTDPAGAPLAMVEIHHLDQTYSPIFTDQNGRFDVTTRVPAIVLRNDGYQPLFVRTSSLNLNRASVRLVMKPASAAPFSTCLPIEQYADVSVSDVYFLLRPAAGVAKLEPINGDDFSASLFRVSTKQGSYEITHGNGQFWSFGIPVSHDVWESVEYHETRHKVGRLDILDARGRFADGTRWRYLGRFGESAYYRHASAEAAAVFDAFLDTACLDLSVRALGAPDSAAP